MELEQKVYSFSSSSLREPRKWRRIEDVQEEEEDQDEEDYDE